jgi:CHRD domain
VTTAASATGTIAVADDRAVIGRVNMTGFVATMAHIHAGAAGKNGPVIVPLTQTSPGEWSVPAGAKLGAEQLKNYQAGESCVNAHSEASRGGEVRARITP